MTNLIEIELSPGHYWPVSWLPLRIPIWHWTAVVTEGPDEGASVAGWTITHRKSLSTAATTIHQYLLEIREVRREIASLPETS